MNFRTCNLTCDCSQDDMLHLESLSSMIICYMLLLFTQHLNIVLHCNGNWGISPLCCVYLENGWADHFYDAVYPEPQPLKMSAAPFEVKLVTSMRWTSLILGNLEGPHAPCCQKQLEWTPRIVGSYSWVEELVSSWYYTNHEVHIAKWGQHYASYIQNIKVDVLS